MKSVLFKSPGVAELADGALQENTEKNLIRTTFSIVSPGTELAILTGNEGWAPLPYVPGYGSVGVVEKPAAGGRVPGGSLVFTYGKHSSLAFDDTVCVPVPEGLAPEIAVFARIAAVSITAIRCSEIELGDSVCVFGAGLVGNFAAQLARASGARVTVVDPSERRRSIALECGIENAIQLDQRGMERVMEITEGKKFNAVIDATGITKVIEGAITCVGKKGELILLGSPRGAYETNLTGFLNYSHLCPENVTIKGAHEWRYHVCKDPSKIYKHSIERNIEIIFGLMMDGRLQVKPLLTHKANPADAQKIYDGLKNDKDSYLGVVFDWRAIDK